MSNLQDSIKTCIQANRVSARNGNFNNINSKFRAVEKKIAGILASNSRNPLKQNPKQDQEPEIIVSQTTSRTLSAFALGSQVAAEKFIASPTTEEDFDKRTVIIDGVEYYVWLFSKTLKHDSNGLCRKVDLDRLIAVSNSRGTDTELLESLIQSRDERAVRSLEGLCTGNSFWIKGVDTQTLFLPKFHRGDSIENVMEMVEVYEKCLLRDVSFLTIQREQGPEVRRALEVLNAYRSLGAYTGPVNKITGTVTGQELFRGIGKDETVGPYISQFLLKKYSLNGVEVNQRYPTEADSFATVDPVHLLNIQRGIEGGRPNFTGDKKYMNCGRVLGSYVHNDPMYLTYFVAAYIAYQNKFPLQHTGNKLTSAWTDQGPPDGLASVADVALGALRVAWNSKFNRFLKLRPEVMAARIHGIMNDELTGDMFATVKKHLQPACATLKAVQERNGNESYRLLGMYPEGSPTHPSTPAGHAVLA